MICVKCFCCCLFCQIQSKNIFFKNSSLITFVRNMLIYIALWCDELISQLVTPWLLWPFLILVDLDVTSCKLNSSHYNILIISELGGFVMSDEFLTKLFLLYYVLTE